MLLEQQSNVYGYFLTLTYDPSSVPEKLEYADISLFLKRLRWNSQASVRFFCVGEYGEKTKRPHWHMILFSRDLQMPLGLSQLPEWPQGGCVVASAEPASMAYVAGYTMKKRLEPLEVRMSRRPGIGLERACEIATELARQKGEVELFPAVLRVGKHLYPMHRKLKEVMQEAYIRAGGVIKRTGRLKLSMDMEAGILVQQAEYRKHDHRNQVLLERILVKDTERHGPPKAKLPTGTL